MSRATGSGTDILPSADDKPRAVEAMFDRIAPRYDALNRALTFRMDIGWRRAAVGSLQLTPGGRVLDLACGTGDLCRTLTQAGARPVGIDFSAGMLRAARTDAPLVRADALRLPFRDATFDALTCGFALRNFAALAPVFEECARVLRPGARVALLDVAEPDNPVAKSVHSAWFRHVVPFVGGIVSDRAAYRYLPASTAYLPPVPELLERLVDSDFVDVSRRRLGFGAAQLITGSRAR
jgi:demethylmenaquinone methyltransferase/2-methoxy-6-polyprenyl-1,4-benzoquinol methylase